MSIHEKLAARGVKPSPNGKAAAPPPADEYVGDHVHDMLPRETPPPTPVATWPSIDAAAFHGLAGELVRVIEPQSEADPVGILFQVLVGFGSLIGRNPYYPHEAEKHYGNEYLLLIGDTAEGRKGTSWGHARRSLAAVDSTWADTRIVGGLSSGEGLIHAVRDSHKDDTGESDKRLLALESEFAAVLKVMMRQGNTLSPVLRHAWEGSPLRVLTKNTPTRCAAPHISIVAHITGDELRRNLSATDAANGLANRFLFVAVRRSKMLPDGGYIDPLDLAPIHDRMTEAAEFARCTDRMARDDEARDLWHELYSRLSSGRPGLPGMLTARALAHVTRLSMLFALLDFSSWIRAAHLRAAVACWDYCAASVIHVFGNTLGNDIADELLERLRECETGLSRTEIRDVFGRHKLAADIDQALVLMEKAGVAERRSVHTGGRPATRWFVATKTP